VSLNNPDVIAGARGPRDERDAIVKARNAERPAGPVEIPDGEVWYQSRYSRYRIQLTSPEIQRLPDGRIMGDRPIVAQFVDGFLRLKPEKNKLDKKTVELLTDHPQLGNLFWNYEDTLRRVKQAQVEQATSVLRDPEKRKLIVAALQAEGVQFDLPAPSKTAEAAVASDSKA
jgi:hypothetical protein